MDVGIQNNFSDITFVVPCYNEILLVDKLVEEITFLAEKFKLNFVFVANGSTDGTMERLEQILPNLENVRICKISKNQGYGFGLQSGIKSVNTKWVGWIHADLQIKTNTLVDISKLAIEENTSVKGVRTGRKLRERIFTTGMNLFCSAIFFVRMRDINGQPTLYKTELLQLAPPPPLDFSFDLHYYLFAIRNKFPLIRPCVTMYPRMQGASSWNTGIGSQIKLTIRTLHYILKLRFNGND